MASDAWAVYNKAKLEIMQGDQIDLDTSTLKCALMTSSYSPAVTTDTTFSGLTGEVAAGNGYSAGGVTVTGVTVTESGGTVTVDCDDITFSASGGNIVFRYALIYDSTNDHVVCYSLIDNAPADVTITDGTSHTFTINASGLFTVA